MIAAKTSRSPARRRPPPCGRFISVGGTTRRNQHSFLQGSPGREAARLTRRRDRRPGAAGGAGRAGGGAGGRDGRLDTSPSPPQRPDTRRRGRHLHPHMLLARSRHASVRSLERYVRPPRRRRGRPARRAARSRCPSPGLNQAPWRSGRGKRLPSAVTSRPESVAAKWRGRTPSLAGARQRRSARWRSTAAVRP